MLKAPPDFNCFSKLIQTSSDGWTTNNRTNHLTPTMFFTMDNKKL